MLRFLLIALLLFIATATLHATQKPQYAKPPRADLTQPILWGATA